MQPDEINIEELSKMMEEMANMPKEELGKRQPGDINSYEKANRERYESKRSELSSPTILKFSKAERFDG